MRKKISVIGAGAVGTSLVQWLANKELGDICLLDIVEDMPKGKALDLSQAGPIWGYDLNIVGTNSYEDTANSDIIVITAGLPRKPGMSRDDLLFKNAEIVKSVTEKVAPLSPNAIIIVVSNPLDAMVYVAYKVSGFPPNRVMGMAGILDTARFRYFVAKELDVSVEDVNGFVLGGHGDTMVPIPRLSTVAGIPITELLPKDKIEEIVERTRKGGGEIVSLLKTGSAFYAPSAAVVQMIESIIKDKKRIFPCCAYCDKEYDVGGYFVGVPVKLGANGVEQVIEVNLLPEEKELFLKSVEAVKNLVEKVKI